MQSSDLYNFLHDTLTQLPSLLVMFICIVVAFVRWKKHPKASLLVLLALMFLVFQVFGFAVIYTWGPGLFTNRGYDPKTVFSVINWVYNLLFVLAMTILLLAIFVQRPSKTT